MYNIYTRADQFPNQSKNKRYKIIINAGGGLFGYVITYLMTHVDYDLYSMVDVVAGSSIGGILSLLYSVNSDYQYINHIFETEGANVFSKKFLGKLRAPAYDNKNLQKFIKTILSDYTLRDIERLNGRDLKIIIPTLDMTLTSPRIFTNIVTDQLDEAMLDTKLTEIGLMTSAAPTYFQSRQYLWNEEFMEYMKNMENPPQYQQRYLLALQAIKRTSLFPNCSKESAICDSGVIQNIPVFTTYTTLKSKLGVKLQDIDILVIGTGDDCNPKQNLTSEQVNSWNLVQWLTNFIIPYVTESNELTSINFGAQMGFNSFRCFNPLNVTGSLDDPSIMPKLKQQCDGIVDEFKQVLQDFLHQK